VPTWQYEFIVTDQTYSPLIVLEGGDFVAEGRRQCDAEHQGVWADFRHRDPVARSQGRGSLARGTSQVTHTSQ
jgi:hypothetical protein